MPKRDRGTPAERRAREARRVVDLLDDAERARAAEHVALESTASPDELAAALARAPRATTLRALAAGAPDVIEMLKDIGLWLEAHGIGARTTGFVLELDRAADTAGLELSAQEIALACSWPDRLDATGSKAFTELLRQWRGLRRPWTALVDHARTRRTAPTLDPTRSVIERETVYKLPRERTDERARVVLDHLLERLRRTIDVLERLPGDARTREAVALLHNLHAAAKDAAVVSARRRARPAARPS